MSGTEMLMSLKFMVFAIFCPFHAASAAFVCAPAKPYRCFHLLMIGSLRHSLNLAFVLSYPIIPS